MGSARVCLEEHAPAGPTAEVVTDRGDQPAGRTDDERVLVGCGRILPGSLEASPVEEGDRLPPGPSGDVEADRSAGVVQSAGGRRRQPPVEIQEQSEEGDLFSEGVEVAALGTLLEPPGSPEIEADEFRDPLGRSSAELARRSVLRPTNRSAIKCPGLELSAGGENDPRAAEKAPDTTGGDRAVDDDLDRRVAVSRAKTPEPGGEHRRHLRRRDLLGVEHTERLGRSSDGLRPVRPT
jgi:hypothetical protein